MKINLPNSIVYAIALMGLSTQNAAAEKNWYINTSFSTLLGNYTDSQLKNNLFSTSLGIQADYLDQYSIALATNTAKVGFKANNPDINQTSQALKFQYHYYSDTYKGKFSAQLVTHNIANDDTTKLTDNVAVLAPKISYLNFANTLSLGLEYVNSDYKNKDFSVQQITPSLGFAFNNGYDWLQTTVYSIKTSDKTLSQGQSNYSAADIKWTHWFLPDNAFGAHSLTVGLLGGQRILAVDNDALAVYNLADIQTGALSIGMGWKLSNNIMLNAIIGNETYENKTLSNSYSQQYAYISLSKQW